jgi:magnesium-transporting ATPase (P-type)
LIIKSSDENGICYVETKNLDGETNLKIKLANKDIQALFPTEDKLKTIDGYILCETPNNAIYKFEG